MKRPTGPGSPAPTRSPRSRLEMLRRARYHRVETGRTLAEAPTPPADVMKPHRYAAWSLLGSSVWLRPVEPGDFARLEAFWERKDLVRSAGPGGTTLPTVSRLARGKGGLTRYSSRRGLVLVGWDPLGVPVGLFSVDPRPDPDEASISFTVPRDGAAVLHESLRLIADAARHRTRLRRLTIRTVTDAPSLAAILEDIGWAGNGSGVWTMTLEPPGKGSHAG
jgi:hypothetical protein